MCQLPKGSDYGLPLPESVQLPSGVVSTLGRAFAGGAGIVSMAILVPESDRQYGERQTQLAHINLSRSCVAVVVAVGKAGTAAQFWACALVGARTIATETAARGQVTAD